MGIAQAGLAFHVQSPIADVRGLISRLLNEEATEIAHPDRGKFDIRNHSDVMVQLVGNVCFICSNDLVWNILANPPHEDARRLSSLLGVPELVLAFCQYDSGDSFGYALIERGETTRSRLQTTGTSRWPSLIEFGEPRAFETRWLSAPYFLEEEDDSPPEEWTKVYYQGNRDILVAEHSLTACLLVDAMQSLFGVCPWKTNVVPEQRFFRLSARKRSWWRMRQ